MAKVVGIRREAQEPQPPLCKDCVYAKRSFMDRIMGVGWRFATCSRIQSEPDLVTGKLRNRHYCSTERLNLNSAIFAEYCGKQAQHFKPRGKR